MKYFKLQEFVASDTAKKYNIDNTPSAVIVSHLNELVDNLLDSLRGDWAKYCAQKGWSKPGIYINSGYRCPALNKKVGGAATSAHMTGYAADLYPLNNKIKEFIAFCVEWVKGRNFDQCIDEYQRWCHIGYKNSYGQHRKQIFKIR